MITAPAKWRVKLRAKIGQYRNRCLGELTFSASTCKFFLCLINGLKIKSVVSQKIPSFNEVVVININTICSTEFHWCNWVKFSIELHIREICDISNHGNRLSNERFDANCFTLPDTWFRPPFWDLLKLQFLRPNSSNLPCLCSTFHLEYPLVLSRFCLQALCF